MAEIADQIEGARQKRSFLGWELLVPLLVHPAKVAIVEALHYIEEPLSAAQLRKVLANSGDRVSESNIRYHLKYLADVGVLEVTQPTSHRHDGSSRMTFFYFARLTPLPD